MNTQAHLSGLKITKSCIGSTLQKSKLSGQKTPKQILGNSVKAKSPLAALSHGSGSPNDTRWHNRL